MLIITQKIGTAVAVGSEVVVKVLNVSGNQVRLGITVPEGMPVRQHATSRDDIDDLWVDIGGSD